MAKLNSFTWQTYRYRHYNEESVRKFKEWIVLHDWQEFISLDGSNAKANAYQATITSALEAFFPLKTTR